MSRQLFPDFFQKNLAAPSYIWPGGIAENCRRLADKVSEVGLLFFQANACLAYTQEDLPSSLTKLGLRFHVHLPLDLPWEDGAEATWMVVSALLDKCSHLHPRAAVLHPPPLRICPEQEKRVTTSLVTQRLRDFLAFWTGSVHGITLLLENTRENDLVSAWPLIRSSGAGICLDLGHLLAFGQETDKMPGIWPHVGMVHLSAPGPFGGHFSLRRLDRVGRERLGSILDRVGPDCILMLEVFNPADFEESRTFLCEWGAASP